MAGAGKTRAQLQEELERLRARIAELENQAVERGQGAETGPDQRILAEALCETAAVLNSTLDLDEVLERILANVGRVVSHDAVNLMLVKEGVAHVVRSQGYAQRGSEDAVTAQHFTVSETASLRTMVETGRPLVVTDVYAYPGWIALPGTEWLRSYIGAPIRLEGEVIGFLNVDSATPGFYTPTHAEWLLGFADQAAVAIRNARLFEDARQHAAELEALRQTSLSLTSSLELEVVLDTILEGVLSLQDDAENADVFLYGDDRLTFGASLWAGGRKGQAYADPRPHGLTYTVARQSSVICVSDIRDHPLFADAPPEQEGAVIGLPLKIADRVVGVMNVGYREPRGFSEAELGVLRLLADQAAIAIENARLYEALLRDAEELERRVTERTAELNAYTDTIAHDLKGPLHLISGYAALLEEDATPEQHECLDPISAACQRMDGMIDQLLLLALLRDAAEAAVPVEVMPLVEAALARFQDRIDARKIAVSVAPELPSALGHAPWIEEVFANLISNAIKYMPPDEPAPRITIDGARQGDRVRYEVWDNGVGISEEDQPRLFQMFTRLRTVKAAGLGLGLSIVHRIVTKLNGEVGVESAPGEGSTFWFTLPAPGAPES